MRHLVVTGYASLDYPVGLAGQVRADATTLIAARDADVWPRAGGCPTFIAGAAERDGQRATPVMWVGQGAEGRLFTGALTARGISVCGIGIVDSPRSPTALMIYQQDGSCICLYDPALDRREALNDTQKDLIAGASHLCISVGPPALMDRILSLCSPDARLYWAVKNDPDAFPPALCARLSARADVIFHSSPEAVLIGPNRAVRVETRGRDGVTITVEDRARAIPAAAIAVADTTGAGDTFAGGFIAAEMAGADPAEAARAGITAAARLLRERSRKDIA